MVSFHNPENVINMARDSSFGKMMSTLGSMSQHVHQYVNQALNNMLLNSIMTFISVYGC